MTGSRPQSRILATGLAVALVVAGCGFQGVNSLPLPGARGQGSGAQIFHVELANVSTLEQNSPVLMQDVVVGSVRKLGVRDWHADVEVSVEPDVVVPANVVANVGQTSLLGSMHVQLTPPVGEAPRGRLESGTTIPLSSSSTYPSTEQTLSSLSLVVNGGGLGQIGDVVSNFRLALDGREGDVRDLLTRLNDFVGVLDSQRDSIVATVEALDRLTGTFNGQRDVIARALRDIPPALEVLNRARPRITEALQHLGDFSRTSQRVINEAQDDLVANLRNVEPLIKVFGDFGPELDLALATLLTFPFTQRFIERAVRGDYFNLFTVVDLTIPRLKRTVLAGTRFGDPNAQLVPAPGEPSYFNYTYDPLANPLSAPPPDDLPPAGMPSAPAEPVLPVAPPPSPTAALGPAGAAQSTALAPGAIFAGPFGPTAGAPVPPNPDNQQPVTGGG